MLFQLFNSLKNTFIFHVVSIFYTHIFSNFFPVSTNFYIIAILVSERSLRYATFFILRAYTNSNYKTLYFPQFLKWWEFTTNLGWIRVTNLYKSPTDDSRVCSCETDFSRNSLLAANARRVKKTLKIPVF